MVVEGRVRLSTGDRTTSEVGPGEAFGTWALVDGSSRGHRAECVEDGVALALQREDFYDRAAGDLTLLQEVVRVLAKRLRALVSDRPEEARVESEGLEPVPEAPAEGEAAPPDTAGATLEAKALGPSAPDTPPTEK
jgi:CRP-like cAMP-binding protein